MYVHATPHGWLVLYFILLLLGVLCFLGGAVNIRARAETPAAGARWSVLSIPLVSLGLAFVFVVPLIDAARAL